jgi:hypothetical protein
VFRTAGIVVAICFWWVALWKRLSRWVVTYFFRLSVHRRMHSPLIHGRSPYGHVVVRYKPHYYYSALHIRLNIKFFENVGLGAWCDSPLPFSSTTESEWETSSRRRWRPRQVTIIIIIVIESGGTARPSPKWIHWITIEAVKPKDIGNSASRTPCYTSKFMVIPQLYWRRHWTIRSRRSLEDYTRHVVDPMFVCTVVTSRAKPHVSKILMFNLICNALY